MTEPPESLAKCPFCGSEAKKVWWDGKYGCWRADWHCGSFLHGDKPRQDTIGAGCLVDQLEAENEKLRETLEKIAACSPLSSQDCEKASMLRVELESNYERGLEEAAKICGEEALEHSGRSEWDRAQCSMCLGLLAKICALKREQK